MKSQYPSRIQSLSERHSGKKMINYSMLQRCSIGTTDDHTGDLRRLNLKYRKYKI